MQNIYKIGNVAWQQTKKPYLPISDANVSLTSSSVNVSAEIQVFRRNTVAQGTSLLGQEKNDFKGNKSSNLM